MLSGIGEGNNGHREEREHSTMQCLEKDCAFLLFSSLIEEQPRKLKFVFCTFQLSTLHSHRGRWCTINFIDRTDIIHFILLSEHMLEVASSFCFSENMAIVLTHWQENYIHQVINLVCQSCPQPRASQDAMKSSCIDLSVWDSYKQWQKAKIARAGRSSQRND